MIRRHPLDGPKPTPYPLAALLRAAFAGSLALAATLPAAAQSASETASVRSHAIGPGALGDVLSSYAAAAGVQLVFDPARLAGQHSGGLQGSHGVREGFELLLRGSGFRAVEKSPGVYALEPRPQGSTTALPAVTVTESVLGNPAITEGSGSYTASGPATSATALGLSLRETPQSVSVLTRQQMDDQGLMTLDDAVKNVTGLVMQKGYYVGESGNFSARGFPIDSLMLDGLPTSLGANGTFNADNEDLAIYDRVEVVRGATGLLSGSGNPSASINMVRKRPTAEAQGAFSASVGSWDKYRVQVDGSKALNQAGTLRGRAVITAQDSRSFADSVHDRNQQFYGILEADLTPATLLTAGVHYRRVDNDGLYSRLPTNTDGSFLDLNRSTNLGNDFDKWEQTTTTVFAELEHRFDNDWKARLAATRRWQEVDMMFSGFARSAGVLRQNTQAYELDNRQDSVDARLSGEYALFGRKHELVIGAGWRRLENHGTGGWASYSWTSSAPAIDPANWSNSAVPEPSINSSLWAQQVTTRQSGLYAATRINVSDSLKLIAGSRLSWYESENLRNDTRYQVVREVTPYGGVVYDLDDKHSVYASYTRIFQPQSAYNASGSLLDPITGSNYEAGIKGEYYGGRLNASLAVFQIDQENRAISDTSGPSPCPGTTSTYCSRASGKVESKGVELEVSGEPLPGWQLVAGYTYVHAEYVKDADPANEGRRFDTAYPTHQFKLSTDYRLPGELDRWRVGGSVYAQSAIYEADTSYRIEQKRYALVGLHAGYRLDARTSLRLNVNNLFDRKYYEGVGWTTGGNQYGAPRNFMLTVNYQL